MKKKEAKFLTFCDHKTFQKLSKYIEELRTPMWLRNLQTAPNKTSIGPKPSKISGSDKAVEGLGTL